MSFAKIFSAQSTLLKAQIIDVEIDLSSGLHQFSIVGLPDKGVEESRDRVSSAIKNSGFTSPKQENKKIIVALAPADVKKEGPAFDVAIALAYLMASEEIIFNPKERLFLGELSLDGELRPIQGVLPLTRTAKEKGFKEIYVPKQNATEAALIDGISVFAVSSLSELVSHLDETVKKKLGRRPKVTLVPEPKTIYKPERPEIMLDLSDIKGQENAKRALEIAAAGGHNIAMYGPPGTGKTMLAKAFAGLLPELSFEDMLEVTSIYSVAGQLKNQPIIVEPPVRTPHHTASYVSLVGGVTNPKPGEVTLAHKGVLFLDEFPEFDKKVIEALRQPLEDRVVTISRAKASVQFPAHFILIAAMNPCPCGNWGSKDKRCICAPAHILRYQQKLSGPIMDRIDLWVEVPSVDHNKLSDTSSSGEKSSDIKTRVNAARILQQNRFKKAGRSIRTNAEMNTKDLSRDIILSEKLKEFFNLSAKRLDLSARAYHRVLKLARTIADLEGTEELKEHHLAEALQYRPKQKTI
jgi:magnesium chelatase family protein